MKPWLRSVVAVLISGALFAFFAPSARSATNNAEKIPLIVIDDVPLIDAIRNLARQAGLNFIIDPRVAGSPVGPGSKVQSPSVKIRWENRSAEDALESLLKAHKLIAVTNSATTVARIAPESASIKPIAVERVGTNSSTPLPLLNLSDLSLQSAIESLTISFGIKVSFDRSFLNSEYARSPWAVSVRWRDITPRQALIALVDNFDLEMTEDTAGNSARISLKKSDVAK